MTTMLAPDTRPAGGLALRTPRLSPLVAAGCAVGALAGTALVFVLTPFAGQAEFVLTAALMIVVTVTAVSWRVEGRRRAVNRLVTLGAATAFLLALIPLGAVLAYTASRGVKRFSFNFLTHSMAGIGPLDSGGGAYHAIIGTLEQVGLATIIAVPLGLLVAIYVTEYGRGRLANTLRFFIDVMTGVPSIVAGLFIFAFWVLALHRGFSGFAAALSLAILMLPVIVRTAEEMIRLVPSTLREASYALGVPKWRTIVSIVLPTALTGITTGVLLAIARVTGETAPLLLTASGNSFIHADPFNGPQSALPLLVFQQTQSAFDVAIDRAWAGALTLILIVVLLYVTARLLTRRNTLARR
ncbi:MAG: phosphate ABC transporter permease PstA [Actinomycetota bacterium]|nr:phosphate ABC transporter permease PstA [Actinomycetota bacterium]